MGWKTSATRRGARRPVSGSISRGDGTRGKAWGLRLFFLLFFAAGSAFMWFAFVVPVLGVIEARSWLATPCTILSSEVEAHSDSDGTTYSIAIRYRYVVQDRSYTSDRYGFLAMSTSGRSGKEEVVRQYPPGSNATCYVNPDDPSEAVIHRGLTGGMAFAAIPLVFVVIGLAGMVYAPRMAGYRPTVADRDGKADYLPDSKLASSTSGDEPVVLTSGSGRLRNAIGLGVFALIWNGFCWSILLLLIVPDEGLVSVPGALLGLFCLIGIGLAGGVGWSLLGLTNPQVRIEMPARSHRLGETLTLHWQVLGSTRRLRSFSIVLEGVEEATYQRGTDTVTDRHTFATYPLLEMDPPDARRLAAGDDAAFELPADTMHSFEARRNKIVWRLRAQGAIPRWPDVNDTFDLALLPQRA